MNFKLGMVVAYIPRSGIDIRKAAGDFFGSHTVSPDMLDSEMISSLFNEWLIFDFKTPSGTTVITEYFLKNPDRLPESLMDELRQIIQTSVYDLFEVDVPYRVYRLMFRDYRPENDIQYRNDLYPLRSANREEVFITGLPALAINIILSAAIRYSIP